MKPAIQLLLFALASVSAMAPAQNEPNQQICAPYSKTENVCVGDVVFWSTHYPKGATVVGLNFASSRVVLRDNRNSSRMEESPISNLSLGRGCVGEVCVGDLVYYSSYYRLGATVTAVDPRNSRVLIVPVAESIDQSYFGSVSVLSVSNHPCSSGSGVCIGDIVFWSHWYPEGALVVASRVGNSGLVVVRDRKTGGTAEVSSSSLSLGQRRASSASLLPNILASMVLPSDSGLVIQTDLSFNSSNDCSAVTTKEGRPAPCQVCLAQHAINRTSAMTYRLQPVDPNQSTFLSRMLEISQSSLGSTGGRPVVTAQSVRAHGLRLSDDQRSIVLGLAPNSWDLRSQSRVPHGNSPGSRQILVSDDYDTASPPDAPAPDESFPFQSIQCSAAEVQRRLGGATAGQGEAQSLAVLQILQQMFTESGLRLVLPK